MSDLSPILFDLPPLDDSNSILLENSSSVDIGDGCKEKKSLVIELLHRKQNARLPIDWNFEKAKFKDTEQVPIFSVARKKISENPKLQPENCFMPTADFGLSEDQPIPVYFLPHQKTVQETTKNWKSALLKSSLIPIHDCAVEFRCLLDITHHGVPKIDLNTKNVPLLENCVLTTTHDTILSLSVESAMMENPLLNALAVAAISDSWFELSPTILCQIIDANIYRYRNSLQSKSLEKAKDFAKFCVEDTTAAVESISVSNLAKRKSLGGVNYWNDSEFYYQFFSHQVAEAINQEFAGTNFTRTQTYKEHELPAMKVALCAQPSTRVVSTYDSAKGIYSLEKTFIHPNVMTTRDVKETAETAHYCESVLKSVNSEYVNRSTTLAENCKTGFFLATERSKESVKVESLPTETVRLHENLFQANKFMFTGHAREWRVLMDRLKVQIQEAPQDLKVWLSAMFWLVMQICNETKDYKHPKDYCIHNIITEKDQQFLRIAVGNQFAELDKNFLTKFFWYDPTKNLVGGLALLFFPFEAELFLSIPNNDPLTNRLFPYKNGTLMRVHNHLFVHGIATTEIYDIRTNCQYSVNSSHVQLRRQIVYGFSGFTCVGSNFGAKEEVDPILIRPVITAYDIIDSIQNRHLVHILPEVDSQIENQFIIDRSLERFAVFPKLSQNGPGFSLTVQESLIKGNAGYNEPKVKNAFTAENSDQITMQSLFNLHLSSYKKVKSNSITREKQIAQEKEEIAVQATRLTASSTAAEIVVSIAIAENFMHDSTLIDTRAIVAAPAEQAIVAAPAEQAVATDSVEKAVAVAPAQQANVATTAEKNIVATANAARKEKKNMLAQQKRQEYLIEKQKKNKQKDLLETKKKRAEEKSIIEKNQIDRDAELAKKLQNLEETAESAEDFIPVVGRGKKKALSATLSKHAISKNDEISKSAIPKPETFAQPKAIAPSIAQPKVVALAVAQPKVVALAVAQPKAVAPAITQPIAAVVAQPIAATVAQPTVIATDQPTVITTDQPTVITTAQSIAETVAQPIAAAVSQSVVIDTAQPAAVIVSQNPETDAIVAAQPQFVESKSVSQETLLEPVDLQETMTLQKFDQVSTQTANASFYQIPKEQVIDTDALNRYLQSMRSSVMHVRLWLQLAPRDRLFSHKKHVVMQDRLPYSLDLLRQHICPCTDQTLRIYSPWSLLISAFDKMVTETPAGASFTTLILNGCQSSIDDARVQMLSKIGKFIFNSVVNMAAYSLAETRTDNACSTCYLCHVAAPTCFCFVPEYVDAKHTIATRMIPMCNDEKCSHQLLEKVSDRSHSDKNAKFAGLRVFFNFDNSITVCESEDDVFKYTINQSSHMPPLPERISNADFTMQENSIILRDLNGHVFALPQAVAQKAYLLAQFMMADT